MVTRLSGGLTPADGSDPRTFPSIWNDTADVIESQGTAITGLQSDVAATESDINALEADSIPTDVTSPSAGEKLVFDGTNWVNLEAYAFVETVTFTSNGTFSKGDYPWLRAIRVKVQGAGGGGGGVDTTSAGFQAIAGAGGGGAYGESFITDISGLDASVTVTCGAGGAGGAAGNNDGSAGGSSSFGALVSAEGGGAGSGTNQRTDFGGLSGEGGSTATADLVLRGANGSPSRVKIDRFDLALGPSGGGSHLGPPAQAILVLSGGDGRQGHLYGGGATGGENAENQATTRSGGTGGNGIVIVELYA